MKNLQLRRGGVTGRPAIGHQKAATARKIASKLLPEFIEPI